MNKLWNWLAVFWLVSVSAGAFTLYLFADDLGMVRGSDGAGGEDVQECHDARGGC